MLVEAIVIIGILILKTGVCPIVFASWFLTHAYETSGENKNPHVSIPPDKAYIREVRSSDEHATPDSVCHHMMSRTRHKDGDIRRKMWMTQAWNMKRVYKLGI